MANEATLEFVDRYLEAHGGEYEMLLENIKTFFKTHARLLDNKKSIYRVYSRSDKQDGRQFKDSWKIAQLMDAGTDIEHVHDIIGITIVCPFNTDAEAVRKLIKGAYFSREFNIIKERPHESAYQARHFVVCRPQLPNICCEIQLKTVFFDSWTVKSHDLTYKSEVVLDPRYSEQMDVLARILSALEKQSDIIRDMVEESMRFDKEKKQLAKKELMDRSFVGLAEIELERAIIEADAGHRLQAALLGDDDDSVTSYAEALGAAAYYRAELGWPSQRVNPSFEEAKRDAENYIKKALELRPRNPALLDTDGFVKIAFAANEREIEAGLQQCRESWNLCRGSGSASVSDVFFEIHKRTAYRKILSL